MPVDRRARRAPASLAPVGFRAVLLDWRGTLAVTLSEEQWVERALARLGRVPSYDGVAAVVAAVRAADGAGTDGAGGRLDAPGVDADADLHRRTYREVLAAAGLDEELCEALYAVESDPTNDVFADDVEGTLRELRRRGVRTAVVSDVHVDVRPVFAAAGLLGLVDTFTLSFEVGAQKPDPAVFRRTLDALGVAPDEALMVGDRSRPDGGAVDVGITTLLLPPLRGRGDRRLHRVLALCA